MLAIQASPIRITVAVLFHSGFGHTARQAEAVRCGIERVACAFALYLTSDEAQARLDDLDLADAIILRRPDLHGKRVRIVQNVHGFDVKNLRQGRLEGQDRGRLPKLWVAIWGQARNTDPICHPRGSTWHALEIGRAHV